MGNLFSNVIRDEHYSRLNKKVNKTEGADTQISAGQEDVIPNATSWQATSPAEARLTPD
jgi:hypothetical protein